MEKGGVLPSQDAEYLGVAIHDPTNSSERDPTHILPLFLCREGGGGASDSNDMAKMFGIVSMMLRRIKLGKKSKILKTSQKRLPEKAARPLAVSMLVY